MKAERVAVPVVFSPMDNNIHPHYEIQKADWIWHPDLKIEDEAAVEFRNRFELDSDSEIMLHVSADERYELDLDGEIVSMGPDRGDALHWFFASYRVRLGKGSHCLLARVWRLGSMSPSAQVSIRGGFILAAEGEWGALLNTGAGKWETRVAPGREFETGHCPHWIGASHILREEAVNGNEDGFQAPKKLMPAIQSNKWGVMKTGWRLFPSNLPDQTWDEARTGKIRAVIPGGYQKGQLVQAEHVHSERATDWTAFLNDKKEIAITAGERVSVLIDLGDYYCAYPVLRLRGRGKVDVEWAEALFGVDADGQRSRFKGKRDEVLGKAFEGLLDRFHHESDGSHVYRPGWWRAGIYVMLSFEAGDKPLIAEDFHLIECRYPLEREGRFASDSAEIDGTIPLMLRGMEMCMHETYMDCPFYEQMMYVGDTRLEMLTAGVISRDERLTKRGIELYDWSRWLWGMVMEHYPSKTPQLCPTFSNIWVSLVNDFAWWHEDADFVKERLFGVRGVLEMARQFMGRDGVLEKLPGWKWTDWVPAWTTGVPPGALDDISCIQNLFYLQALLHAAELEENFGEAIMAQRNRAEAAALATRIVELFWVEERGLLAEDRERRNFSQHSQCLAILHDVLKGERADRAFKAALEDKDLAPVSVYFSYYLFETFRKKRRPDLVLEKMDYWKQMVRDGFKTPLEQPEPSRSDCHAWGSHPYFHFHATLCGIRPDAMHFSKVRIAPQPGSLKRLECRTPHPKGFIELDLTFEGGECRGSVRLPEGAPGVFEWNNRILDLKAGVETIIRL